MKDGARDAEPQYGGAHVRYGSHALFPTVLLNDEERRTEAVRALHSARQKATWKKQYISKNDVPLEQLDASERNGIRSAVHLAEHGEIPVVFERERRHNEALRSVQQLVLEDDHFHHVQKVVEVQPAALRHCELAELRFPRTEHGRPAIHFF